MRHLLRSAIAALLFSGFANAQGVAIGLEGSTAGAGLALTVGISGGVNVRVGADPDLFEKPKGYTPVRSYAELRGNG